MDEFIYLTSEDSPIHSGNTSNDFIIELPGSLNLKGRWECALVDTNRRYTDVYCDWCVDSIVGEKRLPILRRLLASGTQYPLYIPINQGPKQRIRINLTQPTQGTTHIVLHIRPIKGL